MNTLSRTISTAPAPALAGLLALVTLASGCATSASDSNGFANYEPRYVRDYRDNTPLEAVDSLLFAYRQGDYEGVYHLTKPTDKQSAADRNAFIEEVAEGDDWTPALWELDRDVAYTGDRTSADVVASVLSDLEGFLYSDTMRFYCFLDGEHWKIAQHDFEGESALLAPVEEDAATAPSAQQGAGD